MVEQAQAEKPPMQKLADKISTVFVPTVLVLSAITFLVNYFAFDISSGDSLMRAIAVLVISCPCAMGLATPAAIAVGLGRAAKLGILFKNASALESFKKIQQVVFDKTGTLTTGKFTITDFTSSINEAEFKRIVFSLEKFSNHPIAKTIVTEWKMNQPISWKSIEEIKGIGIKATDAEGNNYEAGSFKLLKENEGTLQQHNIYVFKNGSEIGWIDVQDEIRTEAKEVIASLHKKNIKTILLSGDLQHKCDVIAATLGIDEVYAEQTPAQKMEKIAVLNNEVPTAMVGDGINDAPALASADVGIAMGGGGTQSALEAADIVLMTDDLSKIVGARAIARRAYRTIQENLFVGVGVVHVLGITAALLGWIGPIQAALIHLGPDILVFVNSAKLLRVRIVGV